MIDSLGSTWLWFYSIALFTRSEITGKTYKGEFKNGEEGERVYIYADGTRLEGTWKDGEHQN